MEINDVHVQYSYSSCTRTTRRQLLPNVQFRFCIWYSPTYNRIVKSLASRLTLITVTTYSTTSKAYGIPQFECCCSQYLLGYLDSKARHFLGGKLPISIHIFIIFLRIICHIILTRCPFLVIIVNLPHLRPVTCVILMTVFMRLAFIATCGDIRRH